MLFITDDAQSATVTEIIHYWDVDSLGDLGDADEYLSYARYEDQVFEAIHAAYPDAKLVVTQHNTSDCGYTRVSTADDSGQSNSYWGCDHSPVGEALANVLEITGRIWESGDWLVEVQ